MDISLIFLRLSLILEVNFFFQDQSQVLMDADFIVTDIVVVPVPTPTTEPTEQPTEQPTGEADEGLSDGAIAGIAITVIFVAASLVVFMILIIFFSCR